MPKVAVGMSCLLYALASSCRSLAGAKPCFSQDLEVLRTRCAVWVVRTWDRTDQNCHVAAYVAGCHPGLREELLMHGRHRTPVLYPVCVFHYTYTAWAPWSRNNPLQTVSDPHPLTWSSSLWRIPECFHIPPTCQGTEQGKWGLSPLQMERKSNFPSDACPASCWTSFLHQFASGAATAKSSAVGRDWEGTGWGLAAVAYTVQKKFLLLW